MIYLKLNGTQNGQNRINLYKYKYYISQVFYVLTCSFISLSCSCNFCTSEFEVSFPPLFIVDDDDCTFPDGDNIEWWLLLLSTLEPTSPGLDASPAPRPVELPTPRLLPLSEPTRFVGFGSVLPSAKEKSVCLSTEEYIAGNKKLIYNVESNFTVS